MIKVELMDSKQQALASAICAGHSRIWNVFLDGEDHLSDAIKM